MNDLKKYWEEVDSIWEKSDWILCAVLKKVSGLVSEISNNNENWNTTNTKKISITKEQLEEVVWEKLYFSDKSDWLLHISKYENHILDNNEADWEWKYEWFQLFDENDNEILIDWKSVISYRFEAHWPNRIKNLYHRWSCAFIINWTQLLVPKRSTNKDLYGWMWDVAVWEHLKVRETYIDWIRRWFLEEQWIEHDQSRLHKLNNYRLVSESQSELVNFYVYFHEWDKYSISDETESQEWVSVENLTSENVWEKLNFRTDMIPCIQDLIRLIKQ